ASEISRSTENGRRRTFSQASAGVAANCCSTVVWLAPSKPAVVKTSTRPFLDGMRASSMARAPGKKGRNETRSSSSRVRVRNDDAVARDHPPELDDDRVGRCEQKDPDSLPPYPVLDAILRACVEEDRSVHELVALGFDAET